MPKLIGLSVKFQIRSSWLIKNHYSLCIHLGTQDPFALLSKPINVRFLFPKTVNAAESEDSSAPADIQITTRSSSLAPNHDIRSNYVVFSLA